MKLLGGYNAESVFASEIEIVFGVNLAAQPNLEHAAIKQQSFFHRSPHGCAMRMGTAKVAAPGIVVRVKLKQRNRTEFLVDRAQDGQQDGMVSADAQRARSRTENIVQL